MQFVITRFLTEAEYIATTEAAKKAVWLKGILKETLSKICMPTIFMVSQLALCYCKDHVYHERTKHIDVKLYFIRDLIESNKIEVCKILGTYNTVDFGTKLSLLPSLCFAGIFWK